jgi:hypothetical protein
VPWDFVAHGELKSILPIELRNEAKARFEKKERQKERKTEKINAPITVRTPGLLSTVTGYGLDNQCSISGSGSGWYSHHVQTTSGIQQASYLMETGDYPSQRSKVAGVNVTRQLTTRNTKVKNEWSFSSIRACHHGVMFNKYGDNSSSYVQPQRHPTRDTGRFNLVPQTYGKFCATTVQFKECFI